MKTIRRSLSFTRDKKAPAPAAAPVPAAGVPTAAATRVAAPNSPAPAPRKNQIRRSLSFGSRSKSDASNASAASAEAAVPPAEPFKRRTAAEVKAGASLVQAAPPSMGSTPKSQMKRSNSFGRKAKQENFQPPQPLPLNLPKPASVEVLQQKQQKQDIAASQLQRYLAKMGENDNPAEPLAPGVQRPAPLNDRPPARSAGQAGAAPPGFVVITPPLPPTAGADVDEADAAATLPPPQRPSSPTSAPSSASKPRAAGDERPPPPPGGVPGGASLPSGRPPPPPAMEAAGEEGGADGGAHATGAAPQNAPVRLRSLTFGKGGAADPGSPKPPVQLRAFTGGAPDAAGSKLKIARKPVDGAVAGPEADAPSSEGVGSRASGGAAPTLSVLPPKSPSLASSGLCSSSASSSRLSAAATGASPGTAAEQAILYMSRPAGGGVGGLSTAGLNPSQPSPPDEAPAEKKKGTPLRKKLSFTRDKKAAKPAASPTPNAAAAPKPAKKDGEMDDDDLEAYLKSLELNQADAKLAFEKAYGDE